MKKKYKLTENTDKKILEVARELYHIGLEHFSNYYFKDEKFDAPYFEILINKNNNDFNESFFLVVSNEYFVYTQLGCESYKSLKEAIETVKWLYNGGLNDMMQCVFRR